MKRTYNAAEFCLVLNTVVVRFRVKECSEGSLVQQCVGVGWDDISPQQQKSSLSCELFL